MYNDEYAGDEKDLVTEEAVITDETEESVSPAPETENESEETEDITLFSDEYTDETAISDTEDAAASDGESDGVENDAAESDDGEVIDEEVFEDEAEPADEENTEEDTDGQATAAENVSNTEKADKPRRIDSIFDFIEMCVFTIAAVFMLTSFFFRYSIVEGGSMQDTLHDDERLLLSCFLYTPECGDVVVVQDRSTALKTPIVKRVIAVGGQTVRFTPTAVYVDGVKLEEPYVYTEDYHNPQAPSEEYEYSVYPSDALLSIVTDRKDGEYYEILVPESEIFVMGDHRNNSKDSRDIGTLHEDAVIGKVVLRFFPFDKFGKIEQVD